MNEQVNNIFSEVQEAFKYRIYLTDVFDNEQTHIDAIELIRSITEEDEVHIYITSPGGLVSVADMYIAAINECKGHVVTHGVGGVASAAVIVFLAGDERVCTPGSSYMLHNVQYGIEGDSANVKVHVDFYHRLFREKFQDTYKEILTEQEMSELFDRAGEIYLTADEMQDRIDKVVKGPVLDKIQIVRNEKGEYATAFKFADGSYAGAGYTVASDELWTVVSEYKPDSDAKEKEEATAEVEPDPADEEPDDTFEVQLESGYKKTFSVSRVSPKDFNEYSREELVEIAAAFDAYLDPEDCYCDLVDDLIAIIKGEY